MIFAALALLLVGCSQEDAFEGSDNREIKVVADLGSRATRNAFEEGDQMSLFAVEYVGEEAQPLQVGGNYLNNEKLLELSKLSMLGALTHYISDNEQKHFQPINSNWGIVEELIADKKIKKNKKLKTEMLSNRAIDYIKSII